MAFLVAQRVKRLPAVEETQVWSLSWEDPLEKELATHSSTLAWKIPWTKEPGGLQSMGLQRVWHDWATSLRSGPAFRLSCCPRGGPSQLGMSGWQKVPFSPSCQLDYHFWASRTLFFFFFTVLRHMFGKTDHKVKRVTLSRAACSRHMGQMETSLRDRKPDTCSICRVSTGLCSFSSTSVYHTCHWRIA